MIFSKIPSTPALKPSTIPPNIPPSPLSPPPPLIKVLNCDFIFSMMPVNAPSPSVLTSEGLTNPAIASSTRFLAALLSVSSLVNCFSSSPPRFVCMLSAVPSMPSLRKRSAIALPILATKTLPLTKAFSNPNLTTSKDAEPMAPIVSNDLLIRSIIWNFCSRATNAAPTANIPIAIRPIGFSNIAAVSRRNPVVAAAKTPTKYVPIT